jgi:hypothetical protein
MTIEERLRLMLGEQAFAIAALQTEIEKLQVELAKQKLNGNGSGKIADEPADSQEKLPWHSTP